MATARDPDMLADLDVGQRLVLDVTDDASVTAAVAAAGDIDVVIPNAGVIFHAAVEAIPLAELQRLLDLNIIGAIRVAQADQSRSCQPACVVHEQQNISANAEIAAGRWRILSARQEAAVLNP